MPGYALIADDLTGALDAGAPFVRAGLQAALPFSGQPGDVPTTDVVLLNTESREGDSQTAREAALRAAHDAHGAGIARVYKKIDSALRGHPGPELQGVLEVYGGRAVVAPAFPAQGRTTQGGVQLIHGEPALAFGGDVRAALGSAASRCDLYDATTDADLARIAQVAARANYAVWCGTAGLAAYAPAALGLRHGGADGGAPPQRRRGAARVLVVAGSLHPATVAQIDALNAAGWTHLTLPIEQLSGGDGTGLGDLPDRLRRAVGHDTGVVLSLAYQGLTTVRVRFLASSPGAAERILQPLVEAVTAVTPAPDLGFVITGGETAVRVSRALGASAIYVTGEVMPGIPLGVLRLPQGDVPIATKSGGFGTCDALLRAAAALREP